MQAIALIKFDIIWFFCIKYRKKLLFDNDRIEFFKQVCSEIGKRYWFTFDAIGTDGDHVHVFVGAAPRYAPSNVMQIIKSITAKNIFKKYPEIKIKKQNKCQRCIRPPKNLSKRKNF